jgi:competence protein ComEC
MKLPAVRSPQRLRRGLLSACKDVLVEYESRGKVFSRDGVEGQFLWPELSNADSTVAAKNNDSLVLRPKYGNKTLLLPVDAEKQSEHAILTENYEGDLHADVLKVGHHGSKNSTTEEFLHAVDPKTAIISAGDDNPHGNPSPELLERLEATGARILRTDRDGAVHIVTDGNTLEISCFVACPEASPAVASGSAEAPNQNQNKQ